LPRYEERGQDMNQSEAQPIVEYVHVLLCQCPQCGEPVVFARVTASRNLEEVDADTASYSCKCGHVGVLLGLRARQHWVEEWYRNDPGRAVQGGAGVDL
jgi:predicted RNA-binding Zn-ribbon protein involved in translation (DUF1610 family)